MSYQYYNTLLDKTKKKISILLDNIVPKLDQDELKVILTNINEESNNKKTKKETLKLDNLTIFKGQDSGKDTDFSKLTEKELEILYKTFISKELTDRTAVKWRFYHNIKIMKGINIKEIKLNPFENLKGLVDFSVQTEDDQIILISCFDILDLDQFNKILDKIVDFLKTKSNNVKRLFFATNRTYRNIPLEEIIDIKETILVPEVWVEWIDENRPFNSDDLLIINNNELSVAGFNFTGMHDLLDYIYKMSQGGKISIYKNTGYFSENLHEENEIELFWKGLMLKGEKFNDAFNFN